MNLPNKITLLRVILIPAFIAIYLIRPLPEIANEWVALTLFVVAAITDALDGYLARKLKLVTNFGKLMDPLADKMLVCAAFIAFTYVGHLHAWVTIVLISREFYISGLRQLALEQNIVLAAINSAKWKTGLQITLILFFLLPFPFSYLQIKPLEIIFIVSTIAISIYSAAEYTYKTKSLFKSV